MSKRALVTGASEGIGRAFARRLASDGWQLTVVARNENRLTELVRGLSGSGHVVCPADLSTPGGVAAVVAEMKTNACKLLVNNAGYSVYGNFADAPLEDLQKMVRVNCDALVSLSHAFLGTATSGDALIHVASTVSFLPMPGNGLYSATKAFVTAFSETLWFELKSRNVYVMNLCPGITATEFHRRAGGKDEELPKPLVQTPDQVVNVALRALHRRSSPTVVCGTLNRLMAFLTRLMSRKTVIRMMGNIQ